MVRARTGSSSMPSKSSRSRKRDDEFPSSICQSDSTTRKRRKLKKRESEQPIPLAVVPASSYSVTDEEKDNRGDYFHSTRQKSGDTVPILVVDADIRKSSHKSGDTIPVKLDNLRVSPSHTAHIQKISDQGKSLSVNQGDTEVIPAEDWENAIEEETQSALPSDDPHKVPDESPHITTPHALHSADNGNADVPPADDASSSHSAS
ncbi:hypothetical protein TIFTF001_032139 [Ficus carica]|uniref:Uncharacterized protein n=1 Tax=Ficus carica TaxID=3494 RepID=A0AA88J5C8_FICCA|nr:hypothetical protein TIFTF001_032139 [Ficus carica]